MKNWILVGVVAWGMGCASSSHRHRADADAHEHEHGPKCGHQVVKHDDHLDYLHDGHLHGTRGDHSVEHVVAVDAKNPATCTPDHKCRDHVADHEHSAGCEHHSVPHGDHKDYLVSGHLHHHHDGHCDDHGKLIVTR